MNNPFRTRRPAPPATSHDRSVELAPGDIDITGFGFDLRAQGVSFIDDRIVNSDGTLRDLGAPSLVEERAVRLGDAAHAAGLAKTFHDLLPYQSEAERLTGLVLARKDVHRVDRARLSKAIAREQELLTVPNVVRPSYSKGISLWIKAVMVAADAALMANNFILQGNVVALSIVAGTGLATVGVASGSIAGRMAQAKAQRAARGRVPDDTAEEHLDLFASPDGGDRKGAIGWAFAAGAGAVTLGTAIGCIAAAGAALPVEVIGLSLAAGGTVLGSAALEAYGTNLGADRLDRATKDLAAARAQVEHHAELIGARDANAAAVTVIQHGGRNGALASAFANQVITGVHVDEPRIYGYESHRDAATLDRPMPALDPLPAFEAPARRLPGMADAAAATLPAGPDPLAQFLDEVEAAAATPEASKLDLRDAVPPSVPSANGGPAAGGPA